MFDKTLNKVKRACGIAEEVIDAGGTAKATIQIEMISGYDDNAQKSEMLKELQDLFNKNEDKLMDSISAALQKYLVGKFTANGEDIKMTLKIR